MSQLKLIIANEVKTDISTKSFWIGTFIVPLIIGLFGAFAGILMQDADTFNSATDSLNTLPDEGNMTPLKILGMMLGIFPVLFLMMYGSMIFQKVKTEKCNRIVEILATCVPGRTMMLAKIIAVGVVGIIQLTLWFVLAILAISFFMLIAGASFPWEVLGNFDYWMAVIWAIAYFIGGYVFYGSLFAAVGAMTDKNNENQGYVGLLTFVLLGSFYIGEYAVDHAADGFITACCYIPFTSSTVLTVVSASKEIPVWMSITGLIALYAFAALSLAISGKIYTSSLLLKGKKFTPGDIITFLKAR